MRHCLLVLFVVAGLSGCATVPPKDASAEDCSLVDQDTTGSKITKTQKCTSGTNPQGASAPQR